MLATMTFSLELLFSVIIGLVIGYATFGGDEYSHVTTNPCCAFLEDEACQEIPGASVRGAADAYNAVPPNETGEDATSPLLAGEESSGRDGAVRETSERSDNEQV